MFRSTLACVCLLLISPIVFGDATDEMLKRIPHQANGVSVIHIGAIYSTARAQREGWAQRQEIAGAVPVPNFVDTLVTASHWAPGTHDRSWLLVQGGLKRDVVMQDLAKREKAAVETLVGHNVVLTQRRGYFVELDKRTVGAVYPPNRQEVVRWLRFAKSNAMPTVSPYLLDVLKSPGSDHIVAAIDLEELHDPKALQEWLAHTKTLEKRKNELENIAKFACKLKGARLAIRIEDRSIAAEVRFDFEDSVDRYATLVKPLFLEALDELGMSLEEMHKAEPKFEGKTVRLRTTLTDAGLAHVLMAILGPTLHAGPGETESTGSTDPNPELTASRRYFQQVQKLLADLRERNRLASNYNFTATWHESVAKQIDQLSLVNVDPDLAKYGADVSAKLRLLAGSLRGVPLQVRVLEGQRRWVMQYNPPVYGAGWGGGWGGGWGWRPGVWGFQPGSFQYDDNFQAVRARQQEAILAGAVDRSKIWQELEDARNQIRSQMTQKFKVEFDTPVR
jgi:hypothetical protein